jgi:hypothetical protein
MIANKPDTSEIVRVPHLLWIIQASRLNSMPYSDLRQDGKLCGLFRRHAATLWLVRGYVAPLIFADYSGVTRNRFSGIKL